MRILSFYLVSFAGVVLLSSCGSDKSSGSNSPAIGKLAAAFQSASHEHKIPERMLLAVAFHESNMNPTKSSSPYFQIVGTPQQHNLGFAESETAFGVSRSALKLPETSEADELEVQVHAYAKWLSEKLRVHSHTDLNASPQSATERFDWLWAISLAQVSEDRNVRSIWVKDMMNTLNSGRFWQDNRNNGEVLELTPEQDPLNEDKLSNQAFNLLTIDDDIAAINAARRLELTTQAPTNTPNVPKRIEVIHCPLSLSSCLKIQNNSESADVKLGAHYIIPQDNKVISRPLQIADHERRVQITTADGTTKDVKDAIVIMLVGQSGHYVNGIRVNANPNWANPWQLRRLGLVVQGVCSDLARRNSAINRDHCIATDGQNGVFFHEQGERTTYRWGDIPDFDKSLYKAYLNATGANVAGDVSLQLPLNLQKYQAGSEVPIKASFSRGSRWLRLQRAIRCSNKQLVWDTLRTEPTFEKTDLDMNVTVWDAGPNGNGEQFIRVLVYDDNNKILGWSTKNYYIEGYDSEFAPPSNACSPN